MVQGPLATGPPNLKTISPAQSSSILIIFCLEISHSDFSGNLGKIFGLAPGVISQISARPTSSEARKPG